MSLIQKIKSDSKRLVFITTLFGIICTSLVLICPFILSRLIDSISSEIDSLNIFIKLTIIIGIYFIIYLINLFALRIVNKFSIYYKTKLNIRLYDAFINMNYSSIVEKQPMYLADRIFSCVESIYNFYSEIAKSYIISSLKIIISLSIIAIYSPIISIILLFISASYVIFYLLLNKKLQKKSEVLSKTNSLNFSNILSIINEIDYIKMTDNKKLNLSIIEKNINEVNKENMKVTNFASTISLTADSLMNISFVICSVILAILFALNKISIGQYVMLQSLSSLIFPSITSIINANIDARDIKTSYNFISEDIINNTENFGTIKVNNIESIEYNIKTFYMNNKLLYSNLKWKINKRDKILFIGDSGNGKSTLIKALLGFIKINTIKINGINICELDIDDLRFKISYLSQNVAILPGSIKDNILLGKNYDINSILDYSFMKSLLNGKNLDDNLLQRANNISGGEKQKIALARLFLSNPDLILLDECFNALDEDCKIDTLKNLNKKFKDKTIILISHDLSLAKYFNKIYTLTNSKIRQIK